MMKIRNYKTLLAMSVMIAMALTSCVKEQLCELAADDHQATVKFKYDWGKVKEYGLQVPDSMFILVNRVLYQHRGAIAYDTKTKTGKELSPIATFSAKDPSLMTEEEKVEMQKKEETKEETKNNLTDFVVNSGSYKFLTVNYSSKNFDYVDLQGMISNNASALSNATIAYKAYEKGAMKDGKRILEEPLAWSDMNGYHRTDGSEAGFVLLETTPVVIDSTVVKKIATDDQVTITFTPTTVTQNIDVFFDIKKDVSNVDFTVDSVFAVISGVPHKINLGTGGLDISNTDKVVFKTKLVDQKEVPTDKSKEVKDTPTNKIVRCYKNITVLGIIERDPMEADKYVGPGVMQVMIYCNVNMPDGTTQKKMLNGMVNIHKSLQNAKLQTFDPDKQTYCKSREHSDLYISLNLTVDKTMLFGSEDGGIPKWEEVAVPDEFDIY